MTESLKLRKTWWFPSCALQGWLLTSQSLEWWEDCLQFWDIYYIIKCYLPLRSSPKFQSLVYECKGNLTNHSRFSIPFVMFLTQLLRSGMCLPVYLPAHSQDLPDWFIPVYNFFSFLNDAQFQILSLEVVTFYKVIAVCRCCARSGINIPGKLLVNSQELFTKI